jgi:hypothetical protein
MGRLPRDLLIERRPYPHFVCDDVLTAEEIAAAISHWPQSAAIPSESQGYKVLHLLLEPHRRILSQVQRRFWDRFIDRVCIPIIRDTLATFSPWISRKYGALLSRAEIMTVALTEFEGSYSEVGLHVHPHPTWLFTGLLHIEDGGDPTRGTVLFGFDDCDEQEDFTEEHYRMLAQSTRPRSDLLTIRSGHTFEPGRFFSFLDSPISYHGTRTPEPGFQATSSRRMIRMHIAAPGELCQAVYGISRDDYVRLMCPKGEEPHSERIVDCIRQDVRNIFSGSLAAAPELANISVIGGVKATPTRWGSLWRKLKREAIETRDI